MAYITGAIYTPPAGKNLPPVAVIFGPGGEVLSARSMPTVDIGKKFIFDFLNSKAKDFGVGIQVK
jgi:hypothetical protein